MITLEKAIEILELNVKESGSKMPADCADACKLLIEAGKLRLDALNSVGLEFYKPLPGEEV